MRYISHLLIDVGTNPDHPRPGRLWLRNSYRVHQRLCMAFPAPHRKTDDPQFLKPFSPEDFGEHVRKPRGNGSGFLFRIDPLPAGGAAIIVLSAIKPDWDFAFHNAAHLLAAPCQTKPFALEITNGQLLRFRLNANPIRNLSRPVSQGAKRSNGKRRSGKRVSIVLHAEQAKWLSERLAKAGAELLDKPPLIIRSEGLRQLHRGGEDKNHPLLRGALFDGVLKVNDPEKLIAAVHRGIGPAKAFGFGLLSLAPLPKS